MATIEQVRGYEAWTIATDDGSARASFIPARGGIGVSLQLQDEGRPRELLFLEKDFWENNEAQGGAPFLFPICGRQKADGRIEHYRLNGALYRMPIHGFGPRVPWEPASDKGDTLRLTLQHNEATLAAYPFRFRVSLEYRITARDLTCRQTYTNAGDTPMPYYAGFHPYLLTPPPGAGKEKVLVDFSPVERMLYNEDFTDIAKTSAPWHMPKPITEPYLSGQISRAGPDRTIRLLFPDGFRIELDTQTVAGGNDFFPFVQLYTRAEAPFFCAEPWMGVPNGLNRGTFLRWLAPGASESAVYALKALRPGR